MLRTTRDGSKVSRPGRADLDNVLAVLGSVAVPFGFAAKGDFMNFSSVLMNGLQRAGFPNAVAAFQGSAATGYSWETKLPVGDNPSDLDVALCDGDLFLKALENGVELHGDDYRTAVLKPEEVDELGLGELQEELSEQAGRPVNFMVYASPEDLQTVGRPYLRVPNAYNTENYFNKQSKAAAADETQIEDEGTAGEGESLAVAEAQAEALAEGEAMAAEDDG